MTYWRQLVIDMDADDDIVLEGVVYILNHSPFNLEVYEIVKKYVALSSNIELRTAYISGLYRWLKVLIELA